MMVLPMVELLSMVGAVMSSWRRCDSELTEEMPIEK
jgi:hypothetical protein